MSCSKPLPPFVCDSLYYLNRDQLERFSIVCRPMKNFIDRYLHSKPYRVFDGLDIRGGSFALFHNLVRWHPNRDDYSVQQFLAGQKCSIDEPERPWNDRKNYSFAEMRPYLGPTIRIKKTFIDANGDTRYNSEHIAEMESISYLWLDSIIQIGNDDDNRIVAEHFQLILHSPTILQCRKLKISNPDFPFKDHKALYTSKVLEIAYFGDYNFEASYFSDFVEQPGTKPIVVLYACGTNDADKLLGRLKEAFSSAAVPNAFKIIFVIYAAILPEFRQTNQISGEKLELKKGFPMEYQDDTWDKIQGLFENAGEKMDDYFHNYTLERSNF